MHMIMGNITVFWYLYNGITSTTTQYIVTEENKWVLRTKHDNIQALWAMSVNNL